MPSGTLLLGGTPRGQSPIHSRTAKVKGDFILSHSNAVDEEPTSEVTLRDKKTRCSTTAADKRSKDSALRGSGSSLTCPTNKRNATYLNEEEYDEDLAQLDMLLHYVNNLSASLEFLQWENKRISTDLVPTLLTMYDALYARLSEDLNDSSITSLNAKPCPPSSKSNCINEGQNANSKSSSLISSKKNSEKSYHYNNELFIREDDDSVDKHVSHISNENQIIPAPLVCRECEKRRNSKDSQCECVKRRSRNCLTSKQANINNNSNDSGLYDILDTRLSIENDYDIPEDIEKGSDEETPEVGGLCRSSPVITTRPACFNKLTLSQNVSNDKPSPKGGSPLVGSRLLAARRLDPRRFQHSSSRPLSSISSSSSSSSSSNSLPRCPAPGLAYLASVESLENEEEHPESEATRRRDRSLKSRREKSLRAGSDDSGVQCHIISLPAPPTLRPRYCDPNLNYMDRVVLEIIETEEGYVRDLREVIEGYLKHWREYPQHGISLETVESLFSNIEQIYEFNRRFLSELDICGPDPVHVARCFVRNNSGFTIYTDYCTNYPKTVDVLTKMMQREESVQACRERQLSLSHTLPLGSYLLKPVQRVLKYHLLLGNILKHFDKERPGHTDIVNALSTMTGMAHHINDMKRRHEHSVRVQEIQSLLIEWPGNDLTTYGELAAEGTFRIHGFKGPRHVFLFDKMLLLTKKKDENILIYKTHIMCSNLMLIESIPREPLSFHVIPFDCPRLQYTMECRNLDQKREWTLQLKRVIIENFSATIPAHARQLVMELGQAKPEGSALESRGSSSGGSRRTHHAPEYLERRKDRRRTSEVGLNSRLRLRRSSRSRKDKGEKASRSRSASRNRDTEEEPTRKISNESVESEKSKLRLPMWRRRSEPGIKVRRDSAPSTPELSPHPSPNPNEPHICRETTEEPTKRPSSSNFELDSNRLSIHQDRIEFSSTPECEKDTGDEDAAESENVEHVISQLLQHHFQVQQSILNKQRRHILRNKKVGTQYETSDTEVEDSFDTLPPLPTSPPPPLLSETRDAASPGDNDLNDFSLIYDSLLCKDGVDANSTSGWNSDAVSVCSSVTSTNNHADYESLYCSNSHSTSNLDSPQQESQRKMSNYDNLLNIWGSIRCKSPEKKTLPPNPSKDSGPFSLERDNIKQILRRVQSFSEEAGSSSKDKHHALRQGSCPVTPSHATLKILSTREESKERDRPATIAVYDSNADAFDALEKYLSHSCSNKTEKGEKFPLSITEATDNSLTECSSPAISVDDLVNVHPEHKIYSKASVNKGSIRKILSRISLPKSPLSKYTSESPTFPSSLQGDYERGSNRKASKLVSSMARHCSRTIKEKIKQITAEDLEKDNPKEEISDTEKTQNINVYKPSNVSIGARLATTLEQSDYAVPNLRHEQGSRDVIRPDSVLSSSSNWTSSSSSSSTSYSNTIFKKMDRENLLDRTDIIEEIERSPESSPSLSDTSGDNFYEKSFEAIEALLENELFRDSAIYSDHDDIDGFSSRSGTLSPKSSFRLSNYIKSEDIIKKGSLVIDPLIKANDKIIFDHSSQMSPEDSFVNSLTPSEEPQNDEESSQTSCYSSFSDNLQNVRKVPPPIPAKPDGAKSKRIRGSLIQQQLKNLEECTKFPREGASSYTFEGFRSLEDRRKQLQVSSTEKCSESHRFSLSPTPSCSSPLPSYHGGSLMRESPIISSKDDLFTNALPHDSSGKRCTAVEGDIVMARGWVKHVVGKLQFNT